MVKQAECVMHWRGNGESDRCSASAALAQRAAELQAPRAAPLRRKRGVHAVHADLCGHAPGVLPVQVGHGAATAPTAAARPHAREESGHARGSEPYDGWEGLSAIKSLSLYGEAAAYLALSGRARLGRATVVYHARVYWTPGCPSLVGN